MQRCKPILFPLLLTQSLLLSACAIVPFDYPREPSTAVDATVSTTLRREVERLMTDCEGPSGFYPLVAGRDALGARLRLLDLAEKSIDVQYFLMKGDTAGRIFAAGLLRAAERGVRVRFLLDDIFTTIQDEELELLNAHPNIELRLFNPIGRRGVSLINYLVQFKRANRRMHIKSFTVDNQVTIVGGRNIADEYFELLPEGEFLDLDVIGMGPVAADVSMVFDRYWNSSRSLPLEAFSSKFSTAELAKARKEVLKAMVPNGHDVYEDAVGSKLVADIFEGRQKLYPAAAEVVTDNPEKLTTGGSQKDASLVHKLQKAISEAAYEVIVFTPYFVPGEEGVRFWTSVVDSGIKVTMITNSLASSNHASVHAGYAKYRKRIIEAGVELYEIRVNATGVPAKSLTLHTKVLIIDRRNVFVGSPNLDPRSIEINSEMGFFVPNAEMAQFLAEAALAELKSIAYRVELDDRRRLRWRATIDGAEVVENAEPHASLYRRFEAFLLRIVPESQL